MDNEDDVQFKRDLDHFKQFQLLDRTKSLLEKKHRKIHLKTVLNEKSVVISKRDDKEKTHNERAAAALRRQLKEQQAFSKFAKGKRNRKFFPAMSVLNPFLLKLMKLKLKHKYINIFKRKVAAMRN